MNVKAEKKEMMRAKRNVPLSVDTAANEPCLKPRGDVGVKCLLPPQISVHLQSTEWPEGCKYVLAPLTFTFTLLATFPVKACRVYL